MSQSDKHDSSKRAFLRGGAAVGATAGLVVTAPAIASTPTEAVTPIEGETEKVEKKGYRLTKHVSDYYRTAKS